MEGITALFNWNPFDEKNFEMTMMFIAFFVVCGITGYLANNVFGMSDEQFKKEMDRYSEEGRLYAENEWGEFKNHKKPKKPENTEEKKMK